MHVWYISQSLAITHHTVSDSFRTTIAFANHFSKLNLEINSASLMIALLKDIFKRKQFIVLKGWDFDSDSAKNKLVSAKFDKKINS